MTSESLNAQCGLAVGLLGHEAYHSAMLSRWREWEPTSELCLENPISSMKRQKDITLKDEISRSVGVQYATGEEQRNSSRKNEEAEPKRKQ